MSEPPVVYQVRSDVTPESEAEILATIYRFVLDAAEGCEEVIGEDGGEDSTQPSAIEGADA